MGLRYREHSESEGEWSYIWFEKNLQGDIVAIYSPIGIKLASFSYDAWGNFTQIIHNSNAENIVQKTPFRYRGYYYDVDLKLYVTGTRCYDPAIGRFISPDEIEYLGANGDINSYNFYAYCSNNPIMYIDPSGNSIIGSIIVGALIGALVGFVATAYEDYVDDGDVYNGSVDTGSYVANTVAGGTIGATIAGVAPSAFSCSSNLASGEIAIISNGAIAAGTVVATSIAISSFASNNRPGDNKRQNKQFDDAMRELKITDKDKQRRVHDNIKGKNMGYNELIDFIKEVLNLK